MATNYQLIIGGYTVDEVEVDKITIPLTKTYESLTKPTGYYTDFSKSVNIPFTRNNNELFSKIFRTDQVVTNATIDPRKKIDFLVLHNNAMVMRGYCKVTNVYNSQNNKYYQVNLFSKMGELLNDMKQYTFDENADVESKYIIPNPLTSGLMLNRHLVKNSFVQGDHVIDLNNKTDLDYFGFMPTYQGQYPDFESGKEEILFGRIEDIGYDADEHYEREYRSYYQQPFVYVDGLFQLVKKQVEDTTDATIVLDQSWFNEQNPYWTNAIYTCPTLFDEQNEDGLDTETFAYDWSQIKIPVTQQSDLSTHHRQIMEFTHTEGEYIYDSNTKKFIANGPVHFKEHAVWWLYAALPVQLVNGYAKIQEDNPVFVKFKAVNALDNSDIVGANKTYMLYSCSTEVTIGFDDSVDIGVTSRNYPSIVTRPEEGYGADTGFFWGGEFNIEFDVKTTDPFYIVADVYCKNNHDPFECSGASWTPRWDWLWQDFFYQYSVSSQQPNGMCFWIANISSSVEATTNIRTNSELTMNRIWSKEVSIFDTILNYCKMFHLAIDYDDDNQILTFETRNKYFNNYTIEDWSNKVDRTKDFIIQPISFDKKYVTFNYEDGSSTRHEYYQGKYAIPYGEYKVNTGYDFSTEEEDLFTGITPSMICTKKQDSKMFNTHFPDGPNFLGYGYKVLPEEYFVDNDDNGSPAGMSGAFYFRNGTYDVDAVLSGTTYDGRHVVMISDDTDTQIKNSSYCWGGVDNFIVCDKLPAINVYSADGQYAFQFAEPKEIYFNKDLFEYDNATYIYDGFWKNYLDERYSVQNKVLTCYMYITAEDYKNFKFNHFIMIDNVLYMVNKISDFDITGYDSTKVELMQVSDITAYTGGQVTFPYLYTDENDFTVGQTSKTINVYSTSNWEVDTFPAWLNYSITDSTITLSSYGTTTLARYGVVTLVNDEGVTYSLRIHQDIVTYRLVPNRNTITFNSNGGSETIRIDSSSNYVSVVSKPTWITVLFSLVSPSLSAARINGGVSMMITASRNNSTFTRSGYITITDRFGTTATIRVSQLGGAHITRTDVTIGVINKEDIDVIVLNPNLANSLNLLTPRQLDLSTLKISSGTTSTLNTNKIDSVDFTVTPTIYNSPLHEETKLSDGGHIRMTTLDGEDVIWDYNIGVTTTKHLVMISSGDYGTVNVDGTDTTVYYSDVVDGTTITATVTPVNGYEFVRWSDGNTNATRTITVTEDITIVAEYEKIITNLTYGDGSYVALGNGDLIITD